LEEAVIISELFVGIVSSVLNWICSGGAVRTDL